MKNRVLPENVYTSLVGYLESRPLGEVVNLWVAIQKLDVVQPEEKADESKKSK